MRNLSKARRMAAAYYGPQVALPKPLPKTDETPGRIEPERVVLEHGQALLGSSFTLTHARRVLTREGTVRKARRWLTDLALVLDRDQPHNELRQPWSQAA